MKSSIRNLSSKPAARLMAFVCATVLATETSRAHGSHSTPPGQVSDASLTLLDILGRNSSSVDVEVRGAFRPSIRTRTGDLYPLDGPLREMLRVSAQEFGECMGRAECAVSDGAQLGILRRMWDRAKAFTRRMTVDPDASFFRREVWWEAREWASLQGGIAVAIWVALEVVDHSVNPSPVPACKAIAGALTSVLDRFRFLAGTFGSRQATDDCRSDRLQQAFVNFRMVGRYRSALKRILFESPRVEVSRGLYRQLADSEHDPVDIFFGESPFWHAAYAVTHLSGLEALGEIETRTARPMAEVLDAVLDRTRSIGERFLWAEDLRSYLEWRRELLKSATHSFWANGGASYGDARAALIDLARMQTLFDYYLKSVALSSSLTDSGIPRLRGALGRALGRVDALSALILEAARESRDGISSGRTELAAQAKRLWEEFQATDLRTDQDPGDTFASGGLDALFASAAVRPMGGRQSVLFAGPRASSGRWTLGCSGCETGVPHGSGDHFSCSRFFETSPLASLFGPFR